MTLASKVTMARIALVPIFLAVCYLPASWALYAAAAVFLAAALSDLADGALARSMGQVTTFGKFIDPIADKLLVCAAIMVLVENGSLHAVYAFLIMGRELIISGFRLVASSEGNVIAASGLAKLKTVSQIVMVEVLLLGNFPFSLIGVPFDVIITILTVVLTLWSGVDYLVKNWASMKMR